MATKLSDNDMTELRPKAKGPASVLGYHRQLAPNAGVRVSPLCLGAMNFGDAWTSFMGSSHLLSVMHVVLMWLAQANVRKRQPLKFWITSMLKVETSSIRRITIRMSRVRRGLGSGWRREGLGIRWCSRQRCVIETYRSIRILTYGVVIEQYTSGYRIGSDPKALQSNYTGNNTKSMVMSVEASLKKLKTSYIDVLYVHWWDYTTPVEEVMRSLNTLADQGKILYLGQYLPALFDSNVVLTYAGVSDTPAWIVSKANQWARDHGMRPFVVYQGQWSAAIRDFERDIIPMCEAEGMGLAPWGALGSGNFKSEEQRKATDGRKTFQVTERDVAISKVLEKMAKAKGTVITGIA